MYIFTFIIYYPQVDYGRRQWQPTPVFLPGGSHGQRSLVGYSPWGLEESNMTECLHFHVSLSCIGEGNGNPLQCSCLEYPRDRGAWWAAVYVVAKSRTRLKRLSSSRQIIRYEFISRLKSRNIFKDSTNTVKLPSGNTVQFVLPLAALSMPLKF